MSVIFILVPFDCSELGNDDSELGKLPVLIIGSRDQKPETKLAGDFHGYGCYQKQAVLRRNSITHQHLPITGDLAGGIGDGEAYSTATAGFVESSPDGIVI